MTHWTEEFFVENPGMLLDELRRRSEDAGEEVDDTLELVERVFDHQPGTVMDAACGIGHHVVEFADRGLDVAGFDLSEEYVERARGRVRDTGVDDRATVFQGDLREVGEFEETYDLVTLFWTSFGYFDDDTNREILAGLRSRLADGGVLVFEVTNRDALLSELDTDVVIEDDDRLVAETWSYDVPTSRYTAERELFDRTGGGYDHRGSATWTVRAYSVPEIERICRNAGFEEVVVAGSYDGSEPTLEDSQLVVAAR